MDIEKEIEHLVDTLSKRRDFSSEEERNASVSDKHLGWYFKGKQDGFKESVISLELLLEAYKKSKLTD